MGLGAGRWCLKIVIHLEAIARPHQWKSTSVLEHQGGKAWTS
jgi:hypothetical protein